MLTFSRSKLDPELESRDQPVVSSNHNRSTDPSSPLAALLELCIGEEINQMEHVGTLRGGAPKFVSLVVPTMYGLYRAYGKNI